MANFIIFRRDDPSTGNSLPEGELSEDTWDKTLLLMHKHQHLGMSWRKKFEEIETVL